MSRAVFLDFQSLAPQDLDFSDFNALELDCDYHNWTAAEQTGKRIASYDIVLSNKIKLTEQHFADNPQLKLVIILATGTNNVDLPAASRHGVTVCNIVDYSTHSVVQHTFGLMLALVMRLPDYTQAVRQGKWQESPFFGLLDYQVLELYSKTIGIVGYGKIGQGVADIAKAFGMQVLIAESLSGESKFGRTPLNQLLSQVDFLNIHCPLTPESQNLIDREAIAQLPKGSFIINLGRGGIVNEQALYEALSSGHLAGAGLDVLAQEPPTENSSPLFNYTGNNLIITPHTGWASQQARQNLIGQVVGIIKDFQQHRSVRNKVN